MPFREKTAWLSLIAMAVTFGPYFAIVAAGVFPQAPLPNVRELCIFGAVAIADALVVGLGFLILRQRSPEEARMPLDERDQAILSRAMGSAYYVLLGGMIEVGCVMPFNSGGWAIVHTALFMIVGAEVVRNGVVVVSYRRQA